MGILLSEDTPRFVRKLFAVAGFSGLLVESLFCYVIGYSLFMNSASVSSGLVLQASAWLLVCMLVAAIPIAIVAINLRRRRSDALLLAAMPLTLFFLGAVVEVVRNGF